MGKWLGRPSCVVCALWRVCVVEAGLAGPPRPQVAARFGVGISSAPPASTMVEITKMTSPDYLIEINAIAVIPES